MISAFRQAWNSGELVFPAEPASHGQRWFLRTPSNPSHERDLVFIGINPSSATAFSDQRSGGDPTTAMTLKFFPVGEDGAPLDWRSMTVINLLPLIGQSSDLPKWDSEEGRQEILATLEITRSIFETVIPSGACIHLMWGNPNDRKFPWKSSVLELLLPQIATLTGNSEVRAFLSKDGHPLHPGFGGLSHWRGKALCTDARSSLLGQKPQQVKGVAVKMSEAEAEQRFVAMLEADGWTVSTANPDFVDVIATKPGEPRLVAEVKGHTAAPGLDVNTLYGQILNRMRDLSGNTRYAIVIPETLLVKVQRVSSEVRALLKLDTWVVPAEGDPYQVS